MKSRISSISPASKKAPARCGPPSSSNEVTGGSSLPSWLSASLTLSGSFSPLTTTTSAPADSSASIALRGAARETTTISSTSGACETNCESSASRASESKTILRGCFSAPGVRTVSCGSSAIAVPMPTATASTSARQTCTSSRLLASEIHCESPSLVATLPSILIADLNRTQGLPVRACLRNAWFSSRAVAAKSPLASSTSTPSSRKIPSPLPLAFSVGSSLATTTRPIPAAVIASVQAGCLPSWQHGSSET